MSLSQRIDAASASITLFEDWYAMAHSRPVRDLVTGISSRAAAVTAPVQRRRSFCPSALLARGG